VLRSYKEISTELVLRMAHTARGSSPWSQSKVCL